MRFRKTSMTSEASALMTVILAVASVAACLVVAAPADSAAATPVISVAATAAPADSASATPVISVAAIVAPAVSKATAAPVAAAAATATAALNVAAPTMGPVLPAQEAGGERIVLSLDRAIELGLASSETLKQAGESVLGAEATVREAKSGRIPTIDLVAQYGRNILKPVLFLPSDMAEAFGGVTKIEIGEDNDASAVASMTWNAWTGGRVSSAIGVASEVAEAVRSGEIAVADYARFAVQNAYYTVLLADATLKINEAALETTKEAARVARAGHDNGTVSRFDLLRAEVELENRQTPLIIARHDLDSALYSLKRLCGLDPYAELALSDSLGYVDPPDELDDLLGSVKKTNPEIIAIEHQIMAAEMNVKLEKAARWPGLQIGANYLIQGQWSDNTVLGTNDLAHSSAVTAAIVWPLFDGLRAKARIDRARADLRTAEVELTRVSKDKELAVRVSRLTLVNTITALQGRKEAVSLAEEAYRLAEVRLLNGLATPLERLDAELAMTTARGQLAQALYAANVAQAALELTLGGSAVGGYQSAAGKETGDE
jgi:outer membrane protein